MGYEASIQAEDKSYKYKNVKVDMWAYKDRHIKNENIREKDMIAPIEGKFQEASKVIGSCT